MMSLRKFKPTTPGRRHKVAADSIRVPLPSHLYGPSSSTGGRSHGRIALRGRGGGAKHRRLRVSHSVLFSVPSLYVVSLLTDSRRSAPLMLCRWEDGLSSSNWVLRGAIDGIQEGDVIHSGVLDPSVKPSLGSLFYVKDLPLGTIISNVGWHKSSPSMLRAAGTYGTLVSKTSIKVGKRIVTIPVDSTCVVGRVANPSHFKTVLGKAGAKRWLGRRPKVRGAAMNPVDHPHGGGEGKSSGGRQPVSPWGRLTKGWKRK